MTRKIIAVVVALAAFNCVLSSRASGDDCKRYAQVLQSKPPGCMFIWGWNDIPNPAPATMVCCNYGGIPFNEKCAAPKPSCGPPPNAAADTCPGCTGPVAGQPINLSTGNTYIAESDVSVPGLGGGLRLSRTWNSMLPAMQQSSPFMFGTNWRSNYEERLIFNSSDSYLKYARGDGSVWSFGVASVGSQNVYMSAAPANDTTTTIKDGSPSWTLTSKNGEKRLFDAASGVLVSIIDRNGNTTQLSYDTSNRLATVTDPASRHLYFTYVSPSSNLVSTVTSDVGITLSYAYDGQGRLTQVTKPDNTTVSFAYDAGSRITSVTDSNGKILESHTYDVLGRGLTSSRTNGVDAVTVTYPQ